MNAKRILFIVLCVLLATILILTGIVIFKFVDTPDPTPDPTPTEPVQTDPTEAPTEPPTQPTEHVHEYVLTETVNATCTGEGWKIYTCKTCKLTHMPADQHIAPLGHSYDEGKIVEADCVTAGSAEYTCTRCGHVDAPADQQTAPLGHDFDYGRIFEATCTEGGGTQFTCLRCGIVEIKDQTDPLGHQFETVGSVPATCTEDAFSQNVCTREGCTAEEKIIEFGTATGHTAGEWTVLESGEIVQQCSACSTSLTVPATSENYTISLAYLEGITGEDGTYCIRHTVTVSAPDADTFSYTVFEDAPFNDTLTFTYEAGVGVIMEYSDDFGDHRYFVNHAAPLTITITSDGIVVE